MSTPAPESPSPESNAPRAATPKGSKPPRLPIRIDRDLPVSVALQVQGQIEYGIISGHVALGSALPSVRDLARDLSISPVTVSAAYRALQDKGVIRTVRGSGTYVRDDFSVEGYGRDGVRLERAIIDVVLAAERDGVPRAELLALVQGVAAQLPEPTVSLRLVLVGVYAEVTLAYATSLARRLRPCDTIRTTTFDALASVDAEARSLIANADLVLTFAHRAAELEPLVAEGVPIATLKLVPSRPSRVALAEIDPTAVLLLVSAVPEFLPTFRHAAERYAGHVREMRAVVLDDPTLDRLVGEADVVVYGSGSEAVRERIPPNVLHFEYRHEPDPVQVERSLRPTIEHLRVRKQEADHEQETP